MTLSSQMWLYGNKDDEMSDEHEDGSFGNGDRSTINLEKAKELRLQLVAERSAFVSAYEHTFGRALSSNYARIKDYRS